MTSDGDRGGVAQCGLSSLEFIDLELEVSVALGEVVFEFCPGCSDQHYCLAHVFLCLLVFHDSQYMKALPVPIAPALDGYLMLPNRCRHVLQLGEIVRRATACGVTLYWAPLPPDQDGMAFCWSRRILLSPRLLDAEPWHVRRILVHELGHIYSGSPSEALAGAYQGWHVLTEPDEWMEAA